MKTLSQTLLTMTVLETLKSSAIFTIEGDNLSQDLHLSNARWRVLSTLVTSQSSLSVSEIANKMGQSRQSVLRLVNELNVLKLLQKEQNSKHKRSIVYTLSKKGKDHYLLLSKKHQLWLNQFDGQVNDSDLKTTITTLKKLTTILQTHN